MPKLILAAAAVLVLTNIVVLAGVAYNRSGTPVTSIELTERELPITPSMVLRENSGTSLTLKWHALGRVDLDKNAPQSVRLPTSLHGKTPVWLDTEKLVELGFDIPAIERDIDKHKYRLFHRSTEVILVLEYGGDAWRKAVEFAQIKADTLRQEIEDHPGDALRVKLLEQYDSRVERLRTTQSRLYVIDAGLDRRALLDKYSGSDKYLFARGQIGLRWSDHDQQIIGRIRQLDIHRVHVPVPFSRVIADFAGADWSPRPTQTLPPRYKIGLNVGNRLEPWIESVTLIEDSDQESM
jgi:hypothetical protein